MVLSANLNLIAFIVPVLMMIKRKAVQCEGKRKGASGPPQWLRGITFNREAESGNHERKSYGRAPNCQGERVRFVVTL
jgi:hypothetical protein